LGQWEIAEMGLHKVAYFSGDGNNMDTMIPFAIPAKIKYGLSLLVNGFYIIEIDFIKKEKKA
jgi:hypothetical protein